MNIKKRPQTMWRFFFILLFGALLFLPYSGNDAAGTDIASSPKIINIVLSEWSVVPDKTSVQAGPITFSVRNAGPVDRHEFVVFKTDLPSDALPSDSEGVDEKGIGLTLVGEIEGISVGAVPQTASFDLAPGNYVLVCNIWDAGEQESHYHEGMRVGFTVTEFGPEIS